MPDKTTPAWAQDALVGTRRNRWVARIGYFYGGGFTCHDELFAKTEDELREAIQTHYPGIKIGVIVQKGEPDEGSK